MKYRFGENKRAKDWEKGKNILKQKRVVIVKFTAEVKRIVYWIR